MKRRSLCGPCSSSTPISPPMSGTCPTATRTTGGSSRSCATTCPRRSRVSSGEDGDLSIAATSRPALPFWKRWITSFSAGISTTGSISDVSTPNPAWRTCPATGPTKTAKMERQRIMRGDSIWNARFCGTISCDPPWCAADRGLLTQTKTMTTIRGEELSRVWWRLQLPLPPPSNLTKGPFGTIPVKSVEYRPTRTGFCTSPRLSSSKMTRTIRI
mmetsp:Transcript_28404/g.64975  ORF Transcript_28404/g.64975 Transcript_28404/m.64975 type:complete len:215 (-) Transcript_28404:477-1121(-)